MKLGKNPYNIYQTRSIILNFFANSDPYDSY